ncbi:MAG TPA: BON domain-containing protein [Burkholderiales bacterium]|nr:BON domain-containing protein [Burkholderiales bacterium]
MKQTLAKYLSAIFMAFALVSFVGCTSTPTTRNAAEVTEDAAITAKVKSALANDPLVKAYQINVDTFKKVVTLTGTVDSQGAFQRAMELARDTSGVLSVKNNLYLK